MSDIEQITVPERHFVGVRRSLHHSELPPFYTDALPRVFGWVAERGGPASAPACIWHGMDPSTGVCDAQAGVFVPAALQPDGDITPAVTPAGDALKLVHVGGYDTMGASWQRIFAEAGRLGRTPGAGWEIYVDDPAHVDASELRTEIYLPLV
jgi:effector-binding domain-containing protein